jgi:hypothetical protein
VWQDDELDAGEFEIWSQRIKRYSVLQGANTRISEMGSDGSTIHDAQTPAVTYSERNVKQYLVVWSGDDSTDGEYEIWGQRFVGAKKVYMPIVIRD